MIPSVMPLMEDRDRNLDVIGLWVNSTARVPCPGDQAQKLTTRSQHLFTSQEARDFGMKTW